MVFHMYDLQQRTGTFQAADWCYTEEPTDVWCVCPRAVVISVSGAAVQITQPQDHTSSDADKSSCGGLS